MKTIFKKIGLSLAALACAVCAGAGFAVSIPQNAKTAQADAVTLADRDFYIGGAGVRLVNDANGAGLRFHTNLIASQYANVEESGTLIIPNFRYDGELTLDDLNNEAKYRPTHIVTKGVVNGQAIDLWRDFEVAGSSDAFKRATVYLHDIPAVGYGTRMVAVSYVKIDGVYSYTSVIDGSNYISLSDVATKVSNSTSDTALQDRLEPFVVDEVEVTYVLADGSKTTQTVAYGAKLTPPTLDYSEQWAVLEGWQDQYGNTWDMASDEATYPMTLTPVFSTPLAAKQVANVALKDGYGATHTYRAWVNGSTPDVLTDGVPTGFNVLNRYTWYKESESLWAADGRAFYRNCYDQTDISGYEQVRFMLKVETEGNAYIKLANGTNVVNEWLTFELIQTSANVWTLNVYNESGSVVYSKEGVTRSVSGLNDVDSIASLIFCAGTNNANLMAATSTDYDVYVYTTEILGWSEKDVSVFPTTMTSVVWEHIWNNHYFGENSGYVQEGGAVEGVWSEEEAPVGFTKVSEYSWSSTSSNDFPKTGHLNTSTDIAKYSDLYFAMKVENGMDIYVQGASTYTGGDWLYVHMYQAEDGTWSKDFSSLDGSYTVIGVQKALTGTNLVKLMSWVSGINTGSYPRRDKTQDSSIPATAYFTEVRGILKEGATEEDTTEITIPEEAKTVRHYVWRDDKYTDGTNTLTTEGAPEGYTTVLKHQWKSNRITEYTYCFDETVDVSLYSDLYFATKLENGSHIYVRSAGAHYYGTDWLYVHYSKNADGTWTLSVQSLDGYSTTSTQTYTATTLKGLIDNNLYGYRTDTSVTTTSYFTEVLGVLDGDAWGDRVIWSAVDGSAVASEHIGMPAGFTSIYKYTGFTTDKFASLDLTDTIYQEIRFAMLADKDFVFKTGYKYTVSGEATERPTTSIMNNTGSYGQMYPVVLTKNEDGSWRVTIECKRWASAPASGGSSLQTTDTFTADVAGNSLQEIMSTILSASSNLTLYVTEVRGMHTCATNNYKYLGDGTHQAYCVCGEPLSEASECTPTWVVGDYKCTVCGELLDEATVISSHVFYEGGLGTAIVKNADLGDVTAPEGFTQVTRVDGGTWTSSALHQNYYSRIALTNYEEVWFALKIVNGYFAVAGGSSVSSASWIYVHFTKTDAENNLWTVEFTVDGVNKGTYTNQVGDSSSISLPANSLTEIFGYGWDVTQDGQQIMIYANGGDTIPTIYSTEIIGAPVEFVNNVPDDAVTINEVAFNSSYTPALSKTDEAVPTGFDKVMKYEWKQGGYTGGGSKEMPTGALDKTDITAYSDVYFAMKLTGEGANDIWIRGCERSYTGDDWLYVQFTQTDTVNNLWSISVRSPDGFEYTNVQTGVKGTNISQLTQYINGGLGNGLYPRRTDVTLPATVYLTNILGVIGCEDHSSVKYVSNGDGTHNEVCSNCGTLVTEGVVCAGGTATCTAAAVCSTCGVSYGEKLAHSYDWVVGVQKCTACGNVGDTAETVTASAVIDSSNAHLTLSDNAAGITAPEGFSSVTNLFSASGNTWSSKILSAADFATAGLGAYSEVWFAIKVVNGHITQTAPTWTDIDNDSTSPWIGFHLIREEDYSWTIEISKDGVLWGTQTSQTGLTIGDIFNTSSDGGRIVLYQKTDGTNSIADVNIYATEVLGVLEPNMSYHATQIRTMLWRDDKYALSSSTSEPAPVGYTNVVEFNWADNAQDWQESDVNFGLTCIPTDDISGYSDVYFAIKFVGGTGIYVGSKAKYTGEDWLYAHYKQATDGTWSLSVASPDGYAYKDAHRGLTGSTIQALMNWANLDSVSSGMRGGLYPTKEAASETAIIYLTDVWAVAKDAHVAASYVSNGDGTHNAVCACGTIVTANVVCAGGEAACTEGAACSDCGYIYGKALGHSGAWNDNGEYVCGTCGELCGDVDTTLDQQNVALFTNATAITANEETVATIDLSSATDLNITEVKSVALDSLNYTATVSGNKVSFNVLPKNVFGEYVATATVLVEGKEFEITVPVTIVTNMITTDAGMKAMKTVLRGASKAGGADTMNGDGYYMLGGDFSMTKNAIYTFGTTTVPFVGTFDGNGYILQNYWNSSWHGLGDTEWEDTSYLADLAAGTVKSGGDDWRRGYLEGSLFGVMDGHVKNLAFTGAKLGIYGNFAHSGSGLFENVYVGMADIQDSAYNIMSPFFSRGERRNSGTLRNVVYDVSAQNWDSTNLKNPSNGVQIYASLIGKGFTAENVAVYGFDPKYVATYEEAGRANVYLDVVRLLSGGASASKSTDGSEAGIYVEYVNSENATNGADFFTWTLDPNLWKVVNGHAYLKRVTVSGTETTPASTAPATIVATDNNVVVSGATEYCIAWDTIANGEYSAVRLIREVMKNATGATLPAGVAEVDKEDKKQIIVGTFAEYGDGNKIDSLNEVALSDDSYGVYVVGKTIYVLAENQETFVLAAEKLCRELFDYMELLPTTSNGTTTETFTYGDYTAATIAIPSIDYTTEIAFNMRASAFTNVSEEKYTMGFTGVAPFSYFEEMHNTFNYFADYTGSGTWKSGDGGQLCYFGRGVKTTFDAMVDHVVAKIVAEAERLPNMTAINFMIEDNANYCTCSYCTKFLADTVTSSITQLDYNTSVPQLIFLNAVAKKLATNETLVAAGRTIAVEFFAYGLYADAPIVADTDVLAAVDETLGTTSETTTVTYSNGEKSTVLKAEDNLRVWWTSHKANHSFRLMHAANEHMLQSLEGWIASIGAENVDVFMYQTPYRDYFMPLNTWQYQIEWYQDLNNLGVNSYMFNLGNVYNSAEAQTAFSAFKTYIDSRAMTDRTVTFEQLKTEFFGVNGYYGAAGPTMLEFFNQLVSVMEELKQGGDNQVIAIDTAVTDGYVNGYVNPVKLVDYNNTTDNERRQAFFNGSYGLDLVSVYFGGQKTSNSGITGIDIFTYGGQTQQVTLESWYTLCQEALAMVDADSVYAKRINIEALFPEYAFLVLESTYTTNAKWNTLSKTYSGSITSAKGTSSVITKTYQKFYDNVIALGVTKPSEFYDFNTGTDMSQDSMVTVAATSSFFGSTLYGMYESFYMNWGVTFS